MNRDIGALAGDLDGKGGKSAFGTKYFPDETFVGRHTAPGILTMPNNGRDTNTSVFCLTVKSLPHLGPFPHYYVLPAVRVDTHLCPVDGRNVAFGQVVTGLDVVNSIAALFHVDHKPLQEVVITDCGVL